MLQNNRLCPKEFLRILGLQKPGDPVVRDLVSTAKFPWLWNLCMLCEVAKKICWGEFPGG